MKKFLYLIQCEGTDVVYPELIERETSDVIYLSWKTPNEKMHYAPGTTWTRGRNILYSIAMTKPPYDYYIFLDDDLAFDTGSFTSFEELLLQHNPAIATPRVKYFPNKSNDNKEMHTITFWDPCMNAFHQSVFTDRLVLPYIEKFDRSSWWYSGYISLILSNIFYRGAILQLNQVVVSNTKARDYPRTWYLQRGDGIKALTLMQKGKPILPKYLFKGVDSWVYSTLLRNIRQNKSIKKSIRARVIDFPYKSCSSYFVQAATRRKYLKCAPDKYVPFMFKDSRITSNNPPARS